MLTLFIVCLDYVTVISQSSYVLPSHCPVYCNQYLLAASPRCFLIAAL